MDSLLAQISETVSAAQSLEELTRPMLEMLEVVTGLESTYLTTVDLDAGVQHIVYSRNIGAVQIDEGRDVPWEDTLCSRAYVEGRMYSDDAATRWSDAELAVQLNVQTYFSMPIRTGNGALYGTLCGVSTTVLPQQSNAEMVLTLFCKLIAQHIEREQLFQQLQNVNAELASHASTDMLTGLANRRSLIDGLRRMLANGQRDGRSVLVGFIDLDGFKAINDRYGHEVGDEFLVVMAHRLDAMLREGDMLARIGGDEFIVIGLGPLPTAEPGPGDADMIAAVSSRLNDCTIGEFELSEHTIQYSGASVGVVSIAPGTATAEGALRLADEEMYLVKRQRQAQRAQQALADA